METRDLNLEYKISSPKTAAGGAGNLKPSTQAPILNQTLTEIFLKRQTKMQNGEECTIWRCTVKTGQTNKTPVCLPRSLRKNTFVCPSQPYPSLPREGRNHRPEFCINHLFANFLLFGLMAVFTRQKPNCVQIHKT